jgi:hypothetical protein
MLLPASVTAALAGIGVIDTAETRRGEEAGEAPCQEPANQRAPRRRFANRDRQSIESFVVHALPPPPR